MKLHKENKYCNSKKRFFELSAWCRLQKYGIIKLWAADGFKQLHESSLATKSGDEIGLNLQGSSRVGFVCSETLTVHHNQEIVAFSSTVGLENGSLYNTRDLFYLNTIAYFNQIWWHGNAELSNFTYKLTGVNLVLEQLNMFLHTITLKLVTSKLYT